MSGGDAADTQMVKDIAYSYTNAHPDWLTSLSGQVFFTASDSPSLGNQPVARSLWKSDGTSGGTSKLFDGIISGVFSANGSVYFVGGGMLQRTDGTLDGTTLVAAVGTPVGVRLFGTIGDRFFVGLTNSGGTYNVLVSDGTPAGTHGIDVAPYALASPNGAATPIVSGNYLYYFTGQAESWQLWRTDGTDAGTTKVAALNSGSGLSPYNVTALNGAVLIATQDQWNGFNPPKSLWSYDPVSSAMVRLKTFTYLGQPVTLNGNAFFVANDGVHGTQLWKTDGTGQGTTAITDLSLGAMGGIFGLTVSNGFLYFGATSGSGEMLYRTDGTAAGTVAVWPLSDPFGHTQLWDVAGTLLFIDGDALWATDGSFLGTRRVDNAFGFNNGYDSYPYYFESSPAVAAGQRLYYVPIDGPTDPAPLRMASLASLASPSYFRAGVIGPGTVVLAWSDASTDVSGYIIDRSTHSDFATVDRSFYVPTGITSYTDDSANAAPMYYYRVRAIDAGGNSPPSDTAMVGFAVIRGTVFNDANHDGMPDAGETGMPGVTVFVDERRDGELGPGDPFTVTDSSGNYTLGDLLAGPPSQPNAYTVREVVPAWFAQTSPSGYSESVTVTFGQIASGPLFGNVLISSVTIDFSYFTTIARHFNQNGTFATGDLNGDGVVNFTDLVLAARNDGHALVSSNVLSSAAAPLSSGLSAGADGVDFRKTIRQRRYAI